MFTQLQVFTAPTPGEGPLQVVWDLSDKSQLADGLWFFGQVYNIYSAVFRIELISLDNLLIYFQVSRQT